MTEEQKKLVEDNVKLVFFVINKFFPCYAQDEDMISIGTMGLLKAAQKWTPEKGKFSTLAVTAIKHQIGLEIQKSKRQLRDDSKNRFENDSDKYDVFETLESPIDVEADVERRLDIAAAMKNLNLEQRELLRMKYVEGLTFEEIAKIKGYTRQRAFEKVVWAVRIFKKELGDSYK